jgi:hypothetical protein
LLLVAAAAVACGGAVDDGKTQSPPASTAPTSSGSPPSKVDPNDPGNDLPQRSVVPVPMVTASSYDQSCNTTEDCAPLTEATDCGCACPSAAINKRESERASKDLEAHWNACVKNQAPGCGADCIAPIVVCDTTTGLVGVCRLAPR